jgi:low temperature requirement protein LtrA
MPWSPIVRSGPEVDPASDRAWLDLFYDLVFVAAILILSARFSHPGDDGEAAWYCVSFVSIWWIWLATTLHANRFPADDLVYRILVLVQMFLVALVAMAASDGMHKEPGFVSITYGLLTLCVAITYARSARARNEKAKFARDRALEYVLAAAIFVGAGFLPESLRVAAWLVGLAVTIAPAIAHARTAPPLSEPNLIERLGALTIIMCGEAFVKVALAADDNSLDNIDVVTVALEFILVFAVWATYFDDVPKAGVSESPGGRSGWLSAHLLLHLGIVGVAVGVARFVTFHPGQDIPTDDVAAVAVPMAFVYLGMIWLSRVSRRRPLGPLTAVRLAAVLASAFIVLLAEYASWFDTYWSVAAFAFVGIVAAGAEAVARRRTEILPDPDPAPEPA